MKTKIMTTALLMQTLLLLFSSMAWSIEEDEEIKKLEESRSRKYISLTLGVDYDEKLPPMPKDIKAGGDCREQGLVFVTYAQSINTLTFNPKKEGSCTYLVKDLVNSKVLGEFRITVRKSKLDEVMHDLQALLGDIEGINIKIVNNKVVVDGQVLLPKDLNRIFNVIGQFGDQAASIVTISPLALKKISEFIIRDINNPEIEVRVVNEKIILQGFASSCEGVNNERERAEIIAKAYIPDPVIDPAVGVSGVRVRKPSNDGIINMIQCKQAPPPPPQKMVQLVTHYVELKKTYSKGFEFLFAPAIGDNSSAQFTLGNSGSSGGVVSEITGTISNFLPKLNWLKSHGYGRVLQSESIIVKDGKEADFSSGGQFYITNSSANGTTNTPVSYGIVTKITPTIAGEGRSDSVELKINFSYSVPNLLTTPPTVSKNELVTIIDCRSGQSAAVGGLISSQSGTSFNDPNRLPAGQDPIVRLFASKDFQSNQSQFVVFITPGIKASASSNAEKVKRKFKLRD